MKNKIIVANWKMNGTLKSVRSFVDFFKSKEQSWDSHVVFCPPFPFLGTVSNVNQGSTGKFFLGGQDCSSHGDLGAFTGDVSAQMIAEVGGQYVILGHSERRAYYKETDEDICRKISCALQNSIFPIVCIGETEDEYLEGKTQEVLKRSLDTLLTKEHWAEGCIIAYEPIWCIGTGRVPTLQEIEEVHTFIHQRLMAYDAHVGNKTPILYGGSLKSSNAKEILSVPHVDGGLVGGASLKEEEFYSIVKFADQVSLC